jgi:hypothetical protein
MDRASPLLVRIWCGLLPVGMVSRNAWPAVAGESRLTVSLLTPHSPQSCENDQWFKANAPSLPSPSRIVSPSTRGSNDCG